MPCPLYCVVGRLEEERRRTGYTSSTPVLDLPDLSGAFLRRNQKRTVRSATGQHGTQAARPGIFKPNVGGKQNHQKVERLSRLSLYFNDLSLSTQDSF